MLLKERRRGGLDPGAHGSHSYGDTGHSIQLFEKESKMAPETRETMQSSQFPEQKKRWGEGGERHLQGEEEVMESMEQKYRPRKEGQVSEREGSPRKGCNQILDSV